MGREPWVEVGWPCQSLICRGLRFGLLSLVLCSILILILILILEDLGGGGGGIERREEMQLQWLQGRRLESGLAAFGSPVAWP